MKKAEWDAFVQTELARAEPLIKELGFTLDAEQAHFGGERYLFQAVTAVYGPKLVLFGRRANDQKRVVIKATSHPSGIKEINAERRARAALSDLQFSYRRFYAPEELLYTEVHGTAIAVQEFIEQDKTFLERPLAEQFSFALEALKTQEGAHATTYRHLRRASRSFPILNAKDYLITAKKLADEAGGLSEALVFLEHNREFIEQYCGFLTHSDFMPHNIRIRDSKLYLLDYASIRFGNKYESWARFIHFMLLYNPPLADALIQYVRDNRAPEENASLRTIRAYRLIEIIAYYTRTLGNSEGDLRTLNEARITFWRAVLASVLRNEQLSEEVRVAYIAKRDALRSPEEKQRQIGLH